MIFKTLTTKGLYDKRWFTTGWAIGTAAMIIMVMAFYPSFSQDGSFDQIIKNIPEQLKGFVGEVGSLKSLPGYAGSQLFDIRLPMLVLIMVLTLAVNLSATEEESGKLKQLLVQPIGRGRILLEKWLTMVIIVTIIHIVIVLATATSVVLLAGWIEPIRILQVVFASWLLAITVGTIAFAIGFITGRRSLTIAVGSAVAFGSYFLTSFAKAVDWLEPIDVISVFHYYKPVEILKNGIAFNDVFVLATITCVVLAIAWKWFQSRDVTN